MDIFILLLAILGFFSFSPNGQAQNASVSSYEFENDLSLEDILNLTIETPSKKKENFFLTPLSAFVLTKEEIKNSGATNIQEAMRLVPGFLVREQVSGNFEVVTRGLDKLPHKELLSTQTISMTLIMIDNRVVYNYFQGGAFWETLPIGIDDVERIEVIRGATAALYGPNAVTGVIHIITRRPEKNGFSTWGTAYGGINTTHHLGASLSYNKKNEWNFTASVNQGYRGRFMDEYYSYDLREYVPRQNVPVIFSSQNYDEKWPDIHMASKTFGVNAFGDYHFNKHISLGVETGYQKSASQNNYYRNSSTPMSTRTSESYYVDIKNKTHGFLTHLAYLQGQQDNLGIRAHNVTNPVSPAGTFGLPYAFYLGAPQYNDQVAFEYTTKLRVVEAELEHNYETEKVTIRPGIFYRLANHDSRFIGGSKYLTNLAGAIRTEYHLDSWRFIGAVRADKYNRPKKPYQSWQLAVTKAFGSKHILRAVYARANKFPVMAEAYLDADVPYPVRAVSAGNPINVGGNPVYWNYIIHYRSSTDLELTVADAYEVGYRVKFLSNLNFDNDVFYTWIRKLVAFSYPSNVGILRGTENFVVESTGGEARQVGFTSSMNYSLDKDFYTRAYATIQESSWKQNNMTGKHIAVPLLFGGVVVNYKPISRLNLNFNPYFMTKQAFEIRDQKPDENPTAVPAKIILNARVSYELYKGMSVFADARNFLDTRNPESQFSDEIGGLYLLGVTGEY